MTYDETLGLRAREALAERTDFLEKKMFGGLAFMVNTHMACGVVGNDLMVRVGREGHEPALANGAREMDFTGQHMRGMVIVDADRLTDPTELEQWVATAVAFAHSEPPKPPKPPKAAKQAARRLR